MTRRTAQIGGIVAAISLLALVAVSPALASRTGMHTLQRSGSTETATITEVRERAGQYLIDHGWDTLQVGGVMQFERHFYVAVADPATGNGALELIVSRDATLVHPAPGPGMMWNTTHDLMPTGDTGGMMDGAMVDGTMHGGTMGSSMHAGHTADHAAMHAAMHGEEMGDCGAMHADGSMDGGMLGDGMHRAGMHSGGMLGSMPMHDGVTPMDECPMAQGYVPGADEPFVPELTTDQARAAAQAWLDANRPGISTTTALSFPGYVTFVTARDDATVGLLSVQTTTGALWEQTWHGDVVAQDGMS